MKSTDKGAYASIRRNALLVMSVFAMVMCMALISVDRPVYGADESIRPIPSDVTIFDEGIDNPEYSLTDINGTEVSTTAENGKPKILFFFNFGCPRCKEVEENLMKYGLNLSKVDFYMVEAGNHTSAKETKSIEDQAKEFYGQLEMEATAKCYGTGVIDGNYDGSICWDYLKTCGYTDLYNTKKPIVVYISEDNKIMGYSWSYTNIYTAAQCFGINLEKGGHHWEDVSIDKSEEGYIESYKACAACKMERIHSIELTAPATLSSAATEFVYNGKAQTLIPSTAVYTVTGGTATDAGKYEATISLKDHMKCTWARGTFTEDGHDGDFRDKTIEWTIKKANQKPVISTTTKTFKRTVLKSKAQSFTLKVTGSHGTKVFTKVSGSSRLQLNKTTGKITVRKGTAKGKYTIKVKVAAAETNNYNAGTSAVKTITVRVK